mgnify:CR=1 FL=1
MIAIAVDDELLMLRALVKAVGSSPDITSVSGFSSCEEALDFVENNLVDVAFLDVNMRGMGGLGLAEKIKSYLPNCKIVFCTGYEEYAVKAFKLHASRYLLKPISIEDVKAEIDNIKGMIKKDNVVSVKCFGNFEVYVNGEEVKLTPMEFKILLLLMKHPGRVFSADEIYERVWNEKAINTDTIMVHVRNIRDKIEINPKEPKYLKVVWGVGYKIEKNQ